MQPHSRARTRSKERLGRLWMAVHVAPGLRHVLIYVECAVARQQSTLSYVVCVKGRKESSVCVGRWCRRRGGVGWREGGVRIRPKYRLSGHSNSPPVSSLLLPAPSPLPLQHSHLFFFFLPIFFFFFFRIMQQGGKM